MAEVESLSKYDDFKCLASEFEILIISHAILRLKFGISKEQIKLNEYI
jgi:hypothetical protein